MFSLFLSVIAITSVAAVPAPPLRVCADPANLPFSDRMRGGFDNRIAAVIASDLHRQIQFVWMPESRRFVRKTLDAGRCDMLMGAPSALSGVLSSDPYYESEYVLVSRKDRSLRVRSFDDPMLNGSRIGVQIAGDEYTPPAAALARRGLAPRLRAFPISGNAIVRAVESNQIDLAAMWGPAAGYFAMHSDVPLTI